MVSLDKKPYTTTVYIDLTHYRWRRQMSMMHHCYCIEISYIFTDVRKLHCFYTENKVSLTLIHTSYWSESSCCCLVFLDKLPYTTTILIDLTHYRWRVSMMHYCYYIEKKVSLALLHTSCRSESSYFCLVFLDKLPYTTTLVIDLTHYRWWVSMMHYCNKRKESIIGTDTHLLWHFV